jgi:hypothetical protein
MVLAIFSVCLSVCLYLTIINIWINYCPILCNHLCSWNQFFVHSTLQSNAPEHTHFSSFGLPHAALNTAQQLFTALHCTALHEEPQKTSLCTLYLHWHIVMHRYLICTIHQSGLLLGWWKVWRMGEIKIAHNP